MFNLLKGNILIWLVPLLFALWVSSLGLVYLKGEANGEAQCRAEQQLSLISGQENVIQELLALKESQETFYNNLRETNENLSNELKNKIENKETIIKEKLVEKPVKVVGDCSIDYDAVRLHNDLATAGND